MGLALGKEKRLAPLAQANDQRKQPAAFLGQSVLLVGAAIGCRQQFENPMFDQRPQARREDVPGHAQVALELTETADAIEGIPHDQQRPDITDGVQ